MNNTPTIDITAYGHTMTVTPYFGRYANGRLAVKFNCDEGPYATLTVNLQNEYLDEDEVFIKDWSENEALALALINAGWIEYTNREVQAGFVIAKAAHLAGPLLEAKANSLV